MDLIDFESPMLYTKIQPQSFLCYVREDLSKTLPYMGMAATLHNGPWSIVQISNSRLAQGSTWSLKKIGPAVSKKKTFKYYTILYRYVA